MNDELEILLVDDAPDARVDVAELLHLAGYQVRTTSSFSTEFLDWNLPIAKVGNTLAFLKQLLPKAEFIVVTGHSNMNDSIESLDQGIADPSQESGYSHVARESRIQRAQTLRTNNELMSEQRFANQVLDTAEAFILVLDLEGNIIRFNKHFTNATGWKLEDVVGKNWFATCVPEDDRDWIREVFVKTTKNMQTSGVRNSVLTTDGHQREIRWSNTTLRNNEGKITSVLAIGIDVTEVVEAQMVAERSRRLAAIGQTVAGLAHESRNALHRIQASVELLQMDISPKTSPGEELESIQRAALELQSTLDEVRHFAAPIHLNAEPVRLHEVWRQAWKNLALARKDRDAELIEVRGDCKFALNVDVLRMEQVFRNLLENALAACEDPVRIKIDHQRVAPDSVLVKIEDNGTGLSAEQAEKLFEPFFTTKTRGTGLGLSIVQRIIEAHGGVIQLSNAPEHGARFVIQLPLHSGSSELDFQHNNRRVKT